MRLPLYAGIIAVSFALVLMAASGAQAQYTFLNAPFTGTTAPDWTFINAAGDGPILTAPSIDTAGNGWLRLTSNKQNQNSFVYYNNPIPTAYGLNINFTFVIWTPNDEDADGLAIVLFDNNAIPSAGGWGGSLGYAQHSDFGSVGMNGGFVAFGFDEYGNFSNPIEDREGGPGFRPDSVVLRGPMGADRSQGYAYVTGSNSFGAFSNTARTSRPATNRRYDVNLQMTAARRVTIRMKRNDRTTWTTVVNNYQVAFDFPERVKVGYTASTGATTAYHEIRNLVVQTIDNPECVNDSECPSGDYCVAYICADCRTDADCPTGYVCNGDYTCEEETLIELGSFDAKWQDEGIAVSWVTETEIDNAYFDLYRATSIKKSTKGFNNKKKWLKMGPYVKINDYPIPAEGIAPYGTSYEYLDTDVEYGRRYWYKLQDVDLYGTATQHGPCGPVSAWEDCSYEP